MMTSHFASCLTATVALVLTATAALPAAPGKEKERAPSAVKDSLKIFLRTYLGDEDTTTRFSAVFVNLGGEGTTQTIVYVTGEGWCGSGGCLTLVLTRRNSLYEVVTRITVTRPPIRILDRRSHGWRDIGVWVQGGGIQPGYEAVLQFDGGTYPSNPSVSPAKRLIGRAKGRLVMSSEDAEHGVPLYQ